MPADTSTYYHEKIRGVLQFEVVYTVATLPSATANDGMVAVVSDGGPNGTTAVAVANGGVWTYPAGKTLRTVNLTLGTIATTGASAQTLSVPVGGTLVAAKLTAKDALATSDSNYITFTLTNKGQAGAGSTAMLSATASGTTKATGGAAIAAYTARNLPLHATAGNAALVANDCLEFAATATGTLANTVTEATIRLDYIA